MICKACGRQPAKNGPRCSRCASWHWRNGSERPDYVRTDRGLGKIKCNACGEPISEHGSPPCPMFAGRTG